MKIALLTARPPYPPDAGGRIRTFELLKRVSQAHQVTLFTPVRGAAEAAGLEDLSRLFPHISVQSIRVACRDNPVTKLRSLLRTMTSPIPYPWAPYRIDVFTRLVASGLAQHAYDLVHCDQIQVGYAVSGRTPIPRLLTAHNVESRLAGRFAALDRRPWRRAALRWQARKVLGAETHALAAFDHCVATSETDREALRALRPQLDVSVVPNGVDLDAFRSSPLEPGSRTLVFTGAMDWGPNVDAAIFFAREVLPRIRRKLPDVRFHVVGRNPAPTLVRALSSEAVAFSGTVADVRPHLAAARLVVVPLRSGSGTRLKILEAWAMSRPVLSTVIGAEGLPVHDGEDIALADDVDHMAARAVALLTDLPVSSGLAAAGRRLVEAHFGWDTIARALRDVYDLAVYWRAAGTTGHSGVALHRRSA